MAAAVERYGTEEQKRRYLPRFASGELRGGIALTEPDCGTDLQAIRTVARREGDPLRGQRRQDLDHQRRRGAHPGGAGENRSARQPPHKGMSLFIAEKGPGFKRVRKLEKLGYSGIDTAELLFEDCRCPAANLIGRRKGAACSRCWRPRARAHQRRGARRAGLAQGRLEESLRYAQVRKTFGKPIARAPGDPDQARRHGDAGRGRASARRVRRARLRRGRALRYRGRHGEALRHRGCAREQPGGDAHPRRLRLLEGVQHRALLPRRPAARRSARARTSCSASSSPASSSSGTRLRSVCHAIANSRCDARRAPSLRLRSFAQTTSSDPSPTGRGVGAAIGPGQHAGWIAESPAVTLSRRSEHHLRVLDDVGERIDHTGDEDLVVVEGHAFEAAEFVRMARVCEVGSKTKPPTFAACRTTGRMSCRGTSESCGDSELPQKTVDADPITAGCCAAPR